MTPERRAPWSPSAWIMLVAVFLALAAALWLALSPAAYQGVSITAGSSGGLEETTTQASLIEENGRWVIALLALPIGFALLALLGALVRRRLLVLISAIALLTFSIVAGFSIGLYFAPAAVALVVAAALWESG